MPSKNKNISNRTTAPPTDELNIYDYIVPHVGNLISLGASNDTKKATKFEKMVSDIFRYLGFEVEYLGQGTGRNPDAIARFREERTALIIDAKAYKNNYNLGTDDRALYEYVNEHCPKLRKEGINRIAFIIVSNSFQSYNRTFVHHITWKSDIRRFIFITSEALLYLLAYKTKFSLPIQSIINFLTNTTTIVKPKDVIQAFGSTKN